MSNLPSNLSFRKLCVQFPPPTKTKEKGRKKIRSPFLSKNPRCFFLPKTFPFLYDDENNFTKKVAQGENTIGFRG